MPYEAPPEIRVDVSSTISKQLLLSFLDESKSRIIQEKQKTGQKDHHTSQSISILDWRDVQKHRTKGTPRQWKSAMERQPTFYIVINMTKGEEPLIREHLPVPQIRGLFYKDDPLEVFSRGIDAIFNNEIWIPRNVLMNWLHSPDNSANQSSVIQSLSAREISVIKLIAAGLSNKEISAKLFISSSTVKAHIYNIYKKIDVSNRMQAAVWAQKELGVHFDSHHPTTEDQK